MKETLKSRTVYYTVYETSDGKEFEDKKVAQLHEDIISGKIKECEKCKGTGRINERYVNEFQIPMGGHFATEQVSTFKSDKCPMCNGGKYLQQKWAFL